MSDVKSHDSELTPLLRRSLDDDGPEGDIAFRLFKKKIKTRKLDVSNVFYLDRAISNPLLFVVESLQDDIDTLQTRLNGYQCREKAFVDIIRQFDTTPTPAKDLSAEIERFRVRMVEMDRTIKNHAELIRQQSEIIKDFAGHKGDLPSIEVGSQITFEEFEAKAVEGLRMSRGAGWKQAYQDQTNTTHSQMQKWVKQGLVPESAFLACAKLIPAKRAAPSPWSPEMIAYLGELYTGPDGLSYVAIAEKLSERFPFRRFNENIVSGAIGTKLKIPKGKR